MPIRFRQHVRTLRFRLALLYLVVFGVIQTILCGAILQARESYLYADFDERLADRARSMQATIHTDAASALPTIDADTPAPQLNPFRFAGYFFQLRAADGTVIERSPNLGDAALPFSDAARQARDDRMVFETAPHFDANRAAKGESLRVLTTYVDQSRLAPYYLQVATGTEAVTRSVAQLRRLFVVLVPGGLALAALASWLLARRALAPIGDIVRQAESFTPAHLDRRVEPPPGGDEIAELVRVVNAMLDRLADAFRAQERFIADASHELKTPLSVVLAEAQILAQQQRTPEEYDRFVASVLEQLHHLSRLVDSLLTLARADAGFPMAHPQAVWINEIVTEAVQRCEALARHREVRLILNLAHVTAEGLEPVVAGDPNLLRAVVENLLRNAVRHSPVEQAVEVDVALAAGTATVTVQDRGPGIPAAELERVFERYFHIPRGDAAPPGAGLGLAIARGVARLHGGTITARNRAGGGCEFVLKLPLARLDDDDLTIVEP